MSARVDALRMVGKGSSKVEREGQIKQSSQFGSHLFDRITMEQLLPKKVFENLLGVIDRKEQLDLGSADAIADALKSWAVHRGATHYTHWFQPLTHGSAEKHDSFLSRSSRGEMIEQFRGKEYSD